MLIGMKKGLKFSENTQNLAFRSLVGTLGNGDLLTLEHVDVIEKIKELCLEVKMKDDLYIFLNKF